MFPSNVRLYNLLNKFLKGTVVSPSRLNSGHKKLFLVVDAIYFLKYKIFKIWLKFDDYIQYTFLKPAVVSSSLIWILLFENYLSCICRHYFSPKYQIFKIWQKFDDYIQYG